MSDRPGEVFEALADPTRRRVIALLSEQGTATASELADELPVSRQAIAKHLNALQDARLVASERVGREHRYRLTPGPMADAVSWMADVGSAWDERLSRLGKLLERRRGG
jgi:ArsR family transcriptional regulator, cadmium/lead-responsive transcriptional repressor